MGKKEKKTLNAMLKEDTRRIGQDFPEGRPVIVWVHHKSIFYVNN